MVDWEVTAKTVFCDAVDDEVTIIVYQNGTTTCSGRQKYAKTNKEALKELKKKSKTLACKGEACTLLPKYHDELMAKK